MMKDWQAAREQVAELRKSNKTAAEVLNDKITVVYIIFYILHISYQNQNNSCKFHIQYYRNQSKSLVTLLSSL